MGQQRRVSSEAHPPRHLLSDGELARVCCRGKSQGNESNEEQLQLFFERRNKATAIFEKTDIVSEALGNIEDNRLLQIQFLKVMDKVKRKDYVEYVKLTDELKHMQHLNFLKRQGMLIARLGLESGSEKADIEHQLATLATMEKIKDTIFDCLTFFAEKELPEGIKLVDRVMPIHHQMVQVCDNSIVLIFVGLMKTGKSTIVDTIIGENFAPSRTEPMTAIPVRYVHDPNATEPVMLVPFSNELNRVVRSIKKIIVERGKEAVIVQLKFTHLKSLAEKIDRGLIFKATYTGARDVLDASVDIHDIFRLAVQDSLPPSLAGELPLDWNQGLDSFLTVSIRFPHAFEISSSVKLSVIDTPGVNEDGMKKLDLNGVISNAVDVCHYVAFTVLPRNNKAKDNFKLKALISRITTTTRTPTLVMATNRDSLKESPEELETSRVNIANSLRDGAAEYPKESVYIVSGKRKLLGDKMLDYIAKTGKKPSLDDADEAAKKIADDWALFAGQGYDEEEKKEYYETLGVDALKKRCDKLVQASNMKEPLEKMIVAATKNSSILSCNKAIEKTVLSSKDVISYLQRLLTATKADADRVDDLTAICDDVFQRISSGVTDIRSGLTQRMAKFRQGLRADCEKALREFIEKLPTLIEGEEQWDFKSKADADVKVQETMRATAQAFNDAIDKVFEQKRQELEETAGSVQQDVTEKIFRQLARITSDPEKEESFPLNFAKPDLDTTTLGFADSVVSAQEKQTSMKSKLFSVAHGKFPEAKKEVFVVDIEKIRDYARDSLEEYTRKLVTSASQHIDRFMNRNLDGLFLVALRQVSQAREALAETEKLRESADTIDSFIRDLMTYNENLHALVVEISDTPPSSSLSQPADLTYLLKMTLSRLPGTMGSLQSLTSLDLSCNEFTSLPDVLGRIFLMKK